MQEEVFGIEDIVLNSYRQIGIVLNRLLHLTQESFQQP